MIDPAKARETILASHRARTSVRMVRMVKTRGQLPKNPKCTAGVYKTIGTKGVRYGESECVERRAPVSSLQAQACLGELQRIELVAKAPNLAWRRALERLVIQDARRRELRGGPKVCNLVDR
jgi:hypothetical protein